MYTHSGCFQYIYFHPREENLDKCERKMSIIQHVHEACIAEKVKFW